MAFMSIRPTTPGECLVIPKAHVDHFTDLDDMTAQRIMVVAQHIGRRLRSVFNPLRVGKVDFGPLAVIALVSLVAEFALHWMPILYQKL